VRLGVLFVTWYSLISRQFWGQQVTKLAIFQFFVTLSVICAKHMLSVLLWISKSWTEVTSWATRADVHTESNQLIVYGGPALWLEADFIQGAGPLAPPLAQCEMMKWNRNRAKRIDYLVLLSRPNFPHNNLIQQTLSGVHSQKAKIPQPTPSITPNSIDKWTVILYTSNTWELRVKNLKGF